MSATAFNSGVSAMTVSRVLRGSAKVADFTRTRVVNAGEELGCQPDSHLIRMMRLVRGLKPRGTPATLADQSRVVRSREGNSTNVPAGHLFFIPMILGLICGMGRRTNSAFYTFVESQRFFRALLQKMSNDLNQCGFLLKASDPPRPDFMFFQYRDSCPVAFGALTGLFQISREHFRESAVGAQSLDSYELFWCAPSQGCFIP